jgi:bacteriorhodopsin
MLWVFTVIFSLITLLLMWIASSPRHKRSSAESMLMLTALFAVLSLAYLAMALEVGKLYEVVGVKVYPGIVTTPGDVIVKPSTPPVFWVRHVSWILTSPLELLLAFKVAEEASRYARAKEGLCAHAWSDGARELCLLSN